MTAKQPRSSPGNQISHIDYIPYGRQTIDEDDIRAVVEVLRSDWLTTGPMIEAFEAQFAKQAGAKYAVAVSSGTAALHTAMHALGIGHGDEVIVPTMTFVATANSAVYQGGVPVFADVDPHSLLLGPQQVEERITSRTKAVVAVDYAGQPCDYDALRTVCGRPQIPLVADACHALGARYRGQPVGSLADVSIFSFHPVKHITTGEGGMVTTNDPDMASRMRMFRNHGINADHREREKRGSWFYEMVDLGFNYRLTDFQCALGMSQLKKLQAWVARRREIAGLYDEAFAMVQALDPLKVRSEVYHAYHLYVARLASAKRKAERSRVFSALRQKGIGVNVHYIPAHLHPYYRERFGTGPGLCPVAEEAYENIVSLPIFARMTDQEASTVIDTVKSVLRDMNE